MAKGLQQVGRIMLRREGEWWVARYALPDKAGGAVELSRVRMGAAESDEAVKAAFMDVNRKIVDGIVARRFGVAPTWREPEPAPEHERSGHA